MEVGTCHDAAEWVLWMLLMMVHAVHGHAAGNGRTTVSDSLKAISEARLEWTLAAFNAAACKQSLTVGRGPHPPLPPGPPLPPSLASEAQSPFKCI